MKTLLFIVVCIGLSIFIAPYIRMAFDLDPERCSNYETQYEGEYSVPYGTRLKAVFEGCL